MRAIAVKIKISSNHLDKCLNLVRSLAKNSIKENGCLQYDLSHKEDEICIYEIYISNDALELHQNSVHYKEFLEKTENIDFEIEIKQYNVDFHQPK